MPNWVTNRLIVSGNDKDIKQLFNNIKGDEAEQLIDFNKIIPMPESLDITSEVLRMKVYSGLCQR